MHTMEYDSGIRDMFHVYLNRFEFHFLRLHIIKTNKFCFFMHNGRIPGIANTNRQDGNLKHSHYTVALNTCTSTPPFTDLKS